MKQIIYIMSVAFFVVSCKSGPITDSYSAIHGKATITRVAVSPYNPNGKKQYRDIYFDFQPNDRQAAAKYKYKNFSDQNQRLCVKGRCNLFVTWVKKKNVAVGQKFPAVRYEKKGSFGSAPPVIFRVNVD